MRSSYLDTHTHIRTKGSVSFYFSTCMSWCAADEVGWPYLEGMRAMNSSPEGQSFRRYTMLSPSLDLGRSEHRTQVQVSSTHPE